MPLNVQSTVIEEVKLLQPVRHQDARGIFSETYNARDLAECGIATQFVQDNFSLSREKGVVRGLHFQRPPAAQAKLVRVQRGAIFDVAVDIRKGSPTYGQHVSALLSDENWQQIYIPTGFAHGFCALSENTEVIYKSSAYYTPEHDMGIAWNDPMLAIDWPVTADAAIVSARDTKHIRLVDMAPCFWYEAPHAMADAAAPVPA